MFPEASLDENVNMAKLAKHAERYEEMVEFMEKSCQDLGFSTNWSSEEQSILEELLIKAIHLHIRACSHERILKMEKVILGKLEWMSTVATLYVCFLARFIKAVIPDKEMENMVHFLAELDLMHYNSAILVFPSMLDALVVYAARCTLNKIEREL